MLIGIETLRRAAITPLCRMYAVIGRRSDDVIAFEERAPLFPF